MKQALQTTLFGDSLRPVHKPDHHEPLEKVFMQQVKELAEKMGLPAVHIENYCGNAFNVECPCCGNKTLAHCRKTLNKESAGLPDLLGLAWGIELKRHANYEPSPLQTATHEKLRRQGVPVMVATPENVSEAVNFLKKQAQK